MTIKTIPKTVAILRTIIPPSKLSRGAALFAMHSTHRATRIDGFCAGLPRELRRRNRLALGRNPVGISGYSRFAQIGKSALQGGFFALEVAGAQFGAEARELCVQFGDEGGVYAVHLVGFDWGR